MTKLKLISLLLIMGSTTVLGACGTTDREIPTPSVNQGEAPQGGAEVTPSPEEGPALGSPFTPETEESPSEHSDSQSP